MKTSTFKKGDRVRLKAWVTKPKLAGADKLLPQGRVGICDEQKANRIVGGIPYVAVRTPELLRAYHRAIVAVKDLELMPERQVHIVKDGKVYELRRGRAGMLCCEKCEACFNKAPCELPLVHVCPPGYAYQEVTSGKLVS
jgi:hemin uptake protein HemP